MKGGAGPERRAAAYAKRRTAMNAKLSGKTWEEAAAEAGYYDAAGAFNAVSKLMAEERELAYRDVAIYRQESIARLEKLLSACWDQACAGSDKHLSQARLLIKQIGDLRGEALPLEVQIGESDVDRLLRDAIEEHRRRSEQIDRQASAGEGVPPAVG